MSTLPDDNWLQRRYFAWAERHYRQMPPATRGEVERIDRWLYSRRGLGVWLALAMAATATGLALTAAGWHPLLGAAAGIAAWSAIFMAVLSAWLQPERFVGRKAVRVTALATLLGGVGAAVGFLVGRVVVQGGLHPETLGAAMRSALADVAPLLALVVLVLGTALEATALARRRVLRNELERARLVAERDAASRQAAETRLRLLQAQIRPHFIFNTLASLQHWVDTGDARAGPLLRSLTALLRTTTEALDGPLATLAVECDAARRYLEIMQARLGERLRWQVAVAADCAAVEVPAGLVLTLVENAVEHGIEPMLAGGRVDVCVRRDDGAVTVRVVDDGRGVVAVAPASGRRGVGLANSRERLHHRYDDRAMLTLTAGPGGRGSEACVRIEDAP